MKVRKYMEITVYIFIALVTGVGTLALIILNEPIGFGNILFPIVFVLSTIHLIMEINSTRRD